MLAAHDAHAPDNARSKVPTRRLFARRRIEIARRGGASARRSHRARLARGSTSYDRRPRHRPRPSLATRRTWPRPLRSSRDLHGIRAGLSLLFFDLRNGALARGSALRTLLLAAHRRRAPARPSTSPPAPRHARQTIRSRVRRRRARARSQRSRRVRVVGQTTKVAEIKWPAALGHKLRGERKSARTSAGRQAR